MFLRRYAVGVVACMLLQGCGGTDNSAAVADSEEVAQGTRPENSRPISSTQIDVFNDFVSTDRSTPVRSADPATNYFTNPGFEDGLTGWSGCQTDAISLSSDANFADTAMLIASDRCMYRTVSLTAGQSYELSCFVKLTEERAWTGMGLTFANDDFDVLEETPTAVATSGEYARLATTGVAPAGTTSASVWIHSDHGALVDSCRLLATSDLPAAATTGNSSSPGLVNGDFSSLDTAGNVSSWVSGCEGTASSNGSGLVVTDGACVDQALSSSTIANLSAETLAFSCLITAAEGYSDLGVYLDSALAISRQVTSADVGTRVSLPVPAASVSNGLVTIYSSGQLAVDDCSFTTLTPINNSTGAATAPIVTAVPIEPVESNAGAQINLPPVIYHNGITIAQGETVAITTEMINAGDDLAPSDINFGVDNVLGGHFERVGSSGVPITVFSLAEIKAGEIQFVHLGSLVNPSWALVATDESGLTHLSHSFNEFELRTVRGVPQTYKHDWSDEFTGTSVDTAKWAYRDDTKGSVQRPEQVVLEDGVMKILNRIVDNADGGITQYGGGLVSMQTIKQGYFETRVKTASTVGWHEAYWFDPDHPLEEKKLDHSGLAVLELDVMEHITTLDPADTTSGIIGKGTRDYSPFREHETLENGDKFSDDFHLYGLEVTADYIVHYIDREPVYMLPLETLAFGHTYQMEWYTWLSGIGNSQFPPTQNEEVLFDYSRSFKLPDWAVDSRKAQLDQLYAQMYRDLVADQEAAASAGIDLWFEAERFPNQGRWADRIDREDLIYEGYDTVYLQTGAVGMPLEGVSLNPKVMVPINTADTYNLWVRTLDNPDSADRKFAVRVNGLASSTAVGAHGRGGFHWELVGTYSLEKSVSIEPIRTNSDFGRLDRLLLTSDLNYVPEGIGGKDNVILNDEYSGLYSGLATGNTIPSSVIMAKTESEFFSGRPATKIIDGSGLTGDAHSNVHSTMWLSANLLDPNAEDIRPEYLMIELTDGYTLDFMKIWNSNGAGAEGRGVRSMNIYYNNDVTDPGFLSVNPTAWRALKPVLLNKAPGTAQYSKPDVVDLEGIAATRILLEITGDFGGRTVGLSEIQLLGDPQ